MAMAFPIQVLPVSGAPVLILSDGIKNAKTVDVFHVKLPDRISNQILEENGITEFLKEKTFFVLSVLFGIAGLSRTRGLSVLPVSASRIMSLSDL